MSALRALGLGAISGLRSMSGPALVSRAAATGRLSLAGTTLAFLGSPRISKTLLVMVLGEFLGDKLPMTPSRTSPRPSSAERPPGPSWAPPCSRRKDAAPHPGQPSARPRRSLRSAFAGKRLRALVEDAVVLLGGPHLLKGIR